MIDQEFDSYPNSAEFYEPEDELFTDRKPDPKARAAAAAKTAAAKKRLRKMVYALAAAGSVASIGATLIR